MERNIISIEIQPVHDGTLVKWEYGAFWVKRRNDLYACYIPGFDIHYSAKSLEDIEIKAEHLTSAFMDYYMEELPKDNLKCLGTALYRLGFKIGGNAAMSSILKGIPVKSKFRVATNPVDEEFYPDFFTKTGTTKTRIAA